MSKSLGNFFTVRDLLDQGVAGEVIRFVMLGTHYRKPMDWTEKKRDECNKTLTDWFKILQKHGYSQTMVDKLKATDLWKGDAEFLGVLSNDLNTPGALARMHVLAKAKTAEGLVPLAHAMETLGFVSDWSVLDLASSQDADMPEWVLPVVDRLIAERGAARAAKDWDEADRLRDLLNAAGVQVTDIGGAATWVPGPDFDLAKLEGFK